MLSTRWIIGLMLVGAAAGCDSGTRTSAKQNPTTAPTTAPSADSDPTALAPTTAPSSRPAVSELLIDGRPYTFPTAKLRVGKVNDRVVARLYTNDPKAALDDDYKGNHFDLQMKLDDVHEPQMVAMSVWQYQAHSREYTDSPYGIFLEGMKFQLQPYNVTTHFVGTMLMVQVDLDGEFLAFDLSEPNSTPKTVYVKGSLLAPIEYKD